MGNPSARESALRKVVAAARSIVSYHVGIPVGVQRIRGALVQARPYESIDSTVFDKYLAEVVGLPLGSERLEWERQALATKDRQLEAANLKWRDPLFDACYGLIERYGTEIVAPREP